jgi:hypothetical protein
VTAEINGLTGSFPVTNPLFRGGYVYSRAQTPGVATANNFLALFNPLGSGRTLVVAGVFISSSIVGDIAATVDPMRGWLATGVSGGTLEAASAIGRVRSTMPTPAGQIYINNPAATLGASWFNSPPVLGVAKQASPFVHQIPAAVAAGAITLLPGEGTVIRTETGDVDQRWNVSIAWNEF